LTGPHTGPQSIDTGTDVSTWLAVSGGREVAGEMYNIRPQGLLLLLPSGCETGSERLEEETYCVLEIRRWGNEESG
jgi:hypothetical protein